VNYDNSLVVTCYSWARSSGDHLFSCGAIYLPPQGLSKTDKPTVRILVCHV